MHLLRYSDGYGESDFVHAIDGGCVHFVTLQWAKDHLYGECDTDHHDGHYLQHETGAGRFFCHEDRLSLRSGLGYICHIDSGDLHGRAAIDRQSV